VVVGTAHRFASGGRFASAPGAFGCPKSRQFWADRLGSQGLHEITDSNLSPPAYRNYTTMRTGSASPVPFSPEPSTADAHGLILRFVDAYPVEKELSQRPRKLRKAQGSRTAVVKAKASAISSDSGADDSVITLRL
jgi:hypothetical protein